MECPWVYTVYVKRSRALYMSILVLLQAHFLCSLTLIAWAYIVRTACLQLKLTRSVHVPVYECTLLLPHGHLSGWDFL